MSRQFIRPAGVERRPEPVNSINELVSLGGSLKTTTEFKVSGSLAFVALIDCKVQVD
jgi:hypothetical protein